MPDEVSHCAIFNSIWQSVEATEGGYVGVIGISWRRKTKWADKSFKVVYSFDNFGVVGHD